MKLFPFAVLSAALPIAIVGPSWISAQDSTQSSPPRAPSAYLPPDAGEASLLSISLHYLNEPSLLDAAKDASLLSYRVSYFGATTTRGTAVRLIIGPNGSGEILAAFSAPGLREVQRTRNSVSRADVEHVLESIEELGFWSTPSNEPAAEGPGGHKRYVMDGTFWMLEGVREGHFHYVFRRNSQPSALTEIGCFMAKDLVKTDPAPIPMAGCTASVKTNPATASISGSL